MGIFKTKGGYKVKSYSTGKFHRTTTGKLRIYKTMKAAKKAGGFRWKKKM